MSIADHPLHGPIHHLGYVVEDLESTIQRLVGELAPVPSSWYGTFPSNR